MSYGHNIWALGKVRTANYGHPNLKDTDDATTVSRKSYNSMSTRMLVTKLKE